MSVTPSLSTNKMDPLRTMDLNTNKADLSNQQIYKSSSSTNNNNNNNNNRSIALATSRTELYDSTYFIPNYPLKEPLFFVPQIPNLIKVPEPKAPKRPPPPGYDMRTLRKQVEHLSEEIHEKQEIQSLLYHQNEQLWKYIQELLESNKVNAHIMRSEVLKLHVELKDIHRERYQMVEKLQMIRNSKHMLEDLTKELHESQTTVEETEKRKLEAEKALQSAISENAQLEESLHTQVERMQGVHDELDSYRRQKAEEIAIDLADEFFYTNKIVLRAAYFRFRTGVQARFRLNRIYSVILSIYRYHLKTFCLNNWKYFIKKRRCMYKSIHKRRTGKLMMCIALWKLHTALEIMFAKTHRRYVYKKIFFAWKVVTKEMLFDKWALEVTDQLHIMQHKRKIFLHWKQNTIFLEWKSPSLIHAEGIARYHYMHSIFKSWCKITIQVKYELKELATILIPRIIQWHHFRVWHALCGSQWRRRGRLLRRFFKKIKYMVAQRAEYAVTHKYATTIWVGIQQRRALRTWSRFVKIRRMVVTGAHLQDRLLLSPTLPMKNTAGPDTTSFCAFTPTMNAFSPTYRSISINTNTGRSSTCKPISLKTATSSVAYSTINRWQLYQSIQVLSHMKKRWLRNSLLVMIYFTSVRRRQHICKRAGTQLYIVGLASKAIQNWHRYALIAIKKRNKYHTWLLNKIIQSWKDYIYEQIKERKQQIGLSLLETKVKNRLQISLVKRWYEYVCYERRQRHLISYLKWKQTRVHQRHCFNAWRGLWGSSVYWKVKELHIEYIRIRQLNDLKETSIEELESDNKRNIVATRQLEDTLVSLQEAIADQNNIVRQQVTMIAAKEEEKRFIQIRLEESRSQLKEVSEEKQRMMEFEAILQAEIHNQEVEKEQLRIIAADVVKRVENETAELQLEVHSAREQSALAEKIAAMELSKKQEEMEVVRQQAMKLQEELTLKKLELEMLTSDQQVLVEGLEKVHRKLVQADKDGLALIEENEASIRSKTGVVRVLKSNAGLASARVSALYDLVDEYHIDTERIKLNEILEIEHLEIKELKAMQDKLRQELKAINGTSEAVSTTASGNTSDSDVVSVSGKNKGVSLYKNSLTPSTTIHGYKTLSSTSASTHKNSTTTNVTTNHQRDAYKVVPYEGTPTYDHINMRHSYSGSGGAYMNSSSSSYVDTNTMVHNRDSNLLCNRGHAASTITLPYSSGDTYRSKYTISNNDIHYPPPPVVSIPSVVANNTKIPTHSSSSALQGSVLDLISSPTLYAATTTASKHNSTTTTYNNNNASTNNSTTTPSSPSRYRYTQPHTATTTATRASLNNNSGRSYSKAHQGNTYTSLQQTSYKQVQVSPAVSGSIVRGVQSHSVSSPVTKLTSPTSISRAAGGKIPLTFLTAVNSLSDDSHVSKSSNDSGDIALVDHEDVDVDSSIECDIDMKVSSYRYDNTSDYGASDISISDKDI